MSLDIDIRREFYAKVIKFRESNTTVVLFFIALELKTLYFIVY